MRQLDVAPPVTTVLCIQMHVPVEVVQNSSSSDRAGVVSKGAVYTTTRLAEAAMILLWIGLCSLIGQCFHILKLQTFERGVFCLVAAAAPLLRKL